MEMKKGWVVGAGEEAEVNGQDVGTYCQGFLCAYSFEFVSFD